MCRWSTRTVNVSSGHTKPTLPSSPSSDGDPPIDRTAVKSWEDTEFVEAVRASVDAAKLAGLAARMLAQRTVKTPRIPAAACPGSVQR